MDKEIQVDEVTITPDQCIEMAKCPSLGFPEWKKLTGIRKGKSGSYVIKKKSVSFVKWPADMMKVAPQAMHDEMMDDNEQAPLSFPCTPAELVEFVDTAIGIHCFMVPDTFRLAVASNTEAERCNELATLPELRVHHWEELTGVGICEGGSYAVNQDGVFPEKYSNRDLQSLTQEERYILLEHSNRPPLKFPCTPSQLLKFVDGGLQGEFELPEEFRTAVELPALLPQKNSEQSVSSGAPESAEPPQKKRRDTYYIALLKDLQGKVANMTIECIWLHIQQNAGKDGSIFATASIDSATAKDGRKIFKKGLSRSLLRHLKNNTTTNKVQTSYE